MMTLTEQIKAKIESNFAPRHFEIINQSHLHKGHAGDNGTGESHFQLKIVSNRFEGCSRIQRHRMVMDVLKVEMDGGIHALSMDLKAPGEVRK